MATPATAQARIKILEAKRKTLYSLTQNLHDLCTNLKKPEDLRAFRIRVSTIEDTRKDYLQVIDLLNEAKLETNPDFNPNYKLIEMYDELFSVIRFTEAQLKQESQSVDKSNKISIRLPAMQLISFDGDHLKWPMFFQTFKEIIHENDQLTNAERVHYLISKLSGNAIKVISGILPTAENYEIIWETLVERFQNKRILATHYLNDVLKFKPIFFPDSKSLNSFTERIESSVAALKALEIKDLADFIITHLALNKLDRNTLTAFEHASKSENMPSFKSLANFVKLQAKVADRTESIFAREKSRGEPKKVCALISKKKNKCLLCKMDHPLFYCRKFKTFTRAEKINFLKENKACSICLLIHPPNECRNRWSCKVCSSKTHNTLLCDSADRPSITTGVTSLCGLAQESVIYLPTINVNLHLRKKKYTLRTLLDSGSNANIITTEACDKYKIPVRKCKSLAFGMGEQSFEIMGYANMKLSSKTRNKEIINIDFAVVKTITGDIPTSESSPIREFENLELADIEYFKPGKIECILGIEIFSKIILSKKIQIENSNLVAVDTKFGYIILGGTAKAETPRSLHSVISTNLELNEALQTFWSLDGVPQIKHLSPEEKTCEEDFIRNTTRDESGFYTVALPFKTDPGVLGDSRKQAEKRLLALEKKLGSNQELRQGYNETIFEYLKRGFLNKVEPRSGELAYYIPHRAVYRPEKHTSKIRIVLDAGARSTSGRSLNDLLYTGPNLQSDIFKLLTNFRIFKTAISADIEKMFFSIRVVAEHRRFQRILYRFDESEPINTYEFERVPFGLACSPYLARRVLQRLFQDEDTPWLKEALGSSTYNYMDDYLISVPSTEEASKLRDQLVKTFAKAGFNLTKWISNDKEFLKSVPEITRSQDLIHIESSAELKLIGLWWDTARDELLFKVNRLDQKAKCTKRTLLSATASLYDPLGLLAPLVAGMKLIIQKCWSRDLGWDEEVPADIAAEWELIQKEIKFIEKLRIPRHLGVIYQQEVNLIGFSDASERCYGAVLYLRVGSLENKPSTVTLVCAKSRVAPLKKVSLARLELCAAYLLALLVETIKKELEERIKINKIFAFSDSTVTLAWIKSSPHRWHTFIANRTAAIQEILSPDCWHHIAGHLNPSDLISRPPTPKVLVNHKIWFAGPEWLREPRTRWPCNELLMTNLIETSLEAKKIGLTVIQPPELNIIDELADRVSSWKKLLHIIIIIMRFTKLLKTRGPVAVSDRDAAEDRIIKHVQRKHFATELKAIKAQQNCSIRIRKLRPFIKDEIIRVGGRLEHSSLAYECKHPILLPADDRIIYLLIKYIHESNCHTGPSLLIALARQSYWILACRGLARKVTRACNVCFKAKPAIMNPLMGELPACRVNCSRKSFSKVGIDYAGPIFVTPDRRRGAKKTKAYICLFVCLSTKAIHIELVSNLSTDLFLAAFKRFISRRGPVNYILTDGGRNFIGAKRQLNEIFDLIHSEKYNDALKTELTERRIEFRILPPLSPNQAGLWESNVKSVKMHLYRVVGVHTLTYEELNTLLIQIEAILNSRPLWALSEDPSDPTALTPAHFLTIEPLNFIPAPNLDEVGENRVHRYKLIDKLLQAYWKRWSMEYLSTLQTREKWNTLTNPIRVGQMVLLKEPHVPPLTWPLGIVMEIYPGADGIVRVVKIKTKSGSYVRPVLKVCPLPTQ